MKDLITVRDSTDDPITLQLISNRSPVRLTGIINAELKLKDKDDIQLSFKITDASPLLSVLDAIKGKLRFARQKTTLQSIKSPYRGVVFLTDAGNQMLSFPESKEFQIKVRAF